ncbi:FAD-dependent oxidoreductase [Evansella clarkii]|jgi:glycine/D-amino acid oxidase-like deaminating enzyme/nitrite reductase/ring-hydroxylating ferredoxin subunit|uniref:FAD-dependent oxidoreductase n=1 Tax=Evansella clarkii TaxID=79879 RepID=UPI000998200E|nr:FAD-dependent oxidoreductase [Evansella clarkii]
MTNKENNYEGLPRYPESYWLDSVERPEFPPLTDHKETDVVIVGGGITGITTGYLLSKEGYKVSILDGDRIFNGTTGHTTAKVTAQHNLIYDELIEHFGVDFARTYYEANMHACGFIRDFIEEHGLDCDYEEKDAILYATKEKSVSKLEKEFKAYEKLGIPGELADSISINVKAKKALIMKKQAQFHPLKYVLKLVDEFIANGGVIYENSTAVDIMTKSETGQRLTVETAEGATITGNYVLSCSHFPFYESEGYYFSRLSPERSYIIAAKGNTEELDAMYLSVDQPDRSIRTVKINGENYLLIIGDSHKTGQGEPMMKHYENLKTFGEEAFQITDIPYRWSAQDLYTLDKVPYIGPISTNHTDILVATGFRKWGMSSSTVSAFILRDYVLGVDSPEMEIFSPDRFDMDPSLKKFLKENINVAKYMIKGKLEPTDKRPEEVEIDEGCTITVNGSRAGAYRDFEGKLHVVDTTCKHMGCEVEWNNGERTWDCPCHGSRYTYDGEVIEGPAEYPLDRIDPEEKLS